MKQENSVKILSLREFRERFCQKTTFRVLKQAYDNYLQGAKPQQAVSAAAASFGQCKTGDLREHSLIAQRVLNGVNIFMLHTETKQAQQELLYGEWNYHDIPLCIARLDENYACENVAALDFPSNLIVGIYEHKHRYITVVSIEPEQESVITVPQIKKSAHLLALNAMAHYTVYLHEKEYRAWACKHPHGRQIPPPLPDFIDFLREQPLRFAPEVNKENGMFYDPKRAVTIAAYLEQFGKELGFKLTLASADVFGDFSHL